MGFGLGSYFRSLKNRSLSNYPNVIFENMSFVENHKHPGVYINSKGKWDKHIDYIYIKYARLLGLR